MDLEKKRLRKFQLKSILANDFGKVFYFLAIHFEQLAILFELYI